MSPKKDTKRSKKVAQRLTLEQTLSDKQWHSAIGFDIVDSSKQRNKVAMDNSQENLEQFESAGYPGNKRVASAVKGGTPGELLIHRSSRALWRVSADGKRIEPAFADDIIALTGDDEDE
jgi:hypothetical protein